MELDLLGQGLLKVETMEDRMVYLCSEMYFVHQTSQEEKSNFHVKAFKKMGIM
jgi:hypothetical protein